MIVAGGARIIPQTDVAPTTVSVPPPAIEPAPLRATGGDRLEADGGLQRLAGAHTIVVPGWRDPAERPSEELLDALREAHDCGPSDYRRRFERDAGRIATAATA